MRFFFVILLCLAFFNTPTTFGKEIKDCTKSDLVMALWEKEASKQLHPRDGDGGKAIGPFQIHRAYWQDAYDFDPSLGGSYQKCKEYDYAVQVIHTYWRRYVPKAYADGNIEILARTHNGGLLGSKRKKTIKYWNDIKTILRKQ